MTSREGAGSVEAAMAAELQRRFDEVVDALASSEAARQKAERENEVLRLKLGMIPADETEDALKDALIESQARCQKAEEERDANARDFENARAEVARLRGLLNTPGPMRPTSDPGARPVTPKDR